MEEPRRRQLHSCDSCRKGKRGCDAPKDREDNGFSSCSNCKRWKKNCTFNWLSSKRPGSTSRRKPTPGILNMSSTNHVPSNLSSYNDVFDKVLCFSQSYPGKSSRSTKSLNMASLSPGSSSSYQEGAALDDSQEEELNQGQPHLVSRNMSSPGDWQSNPITQQPETAFEQLESQIAFYDSPPTYREKNYDLTKLRGKFSTDFVTPPNRGSGHKHSTAPEPNRKKQFNSQRGLCLASENTAHDYSRSAMTQNLIRIYHDSMENALSCWLTEHNCPYSNSASDMMPHSERKEWGPSWSNRMCIRVCRLDRASSSARGRALSAEEDKTAARALHLAIMAFASQWTQHARKGTALSVPEHFDLDERSIRQNVWNKARHALEHSAKIPSFRIIFANIIFSLTQCPLDDAEDNSLGQLLENDIAPMFLEIANRQLFTFRHKFTILQREGPQWIREHRRGSMRSTTTEMLEVPEHSEPPHFDPILACYEYRSTLSLLSWLGIMFDTLSSAMYQRPLVVSDEDSQIASAPTSNFHSNYQVDLDGWNIPRDESRNQADVWGDFFLRRPIKPHGLSEDQPRWPCSYERAAAVLSEATPVKVLLYRRLTQLQTLIYREASSGCFEEIIQKTIQVYRYWNCTYQKFMLDCVANHNLLPPRIQSWYVILDCHWHLAAMLLADVIESIDHGRLGSDTERQARLTGNFVSTLRMDNALAVGALARSSLHGESSATNRLFHDSLNEVAFLIEPWTVVLVHSFAKAGQICLDSLDMQHREQKMLAWRYWQTCEACITALRFLGRKSDMAFLAAQNISSSLKCSASPVITFNRGAV